MEAVSFVIMIAGISILAIFNYYLNLAPGSDPEDFVVGPPQLNLTCDCYLNTLILGGILVIAFSAASSLFSSRVELYLFGGLAFGIVTLAGIVGRKKRHAEWREDQKVIRRAIQKANPLGSGRGPIDIVFDEDDDDDDFDFDDY